ncbi:hypothetical protein CIT14_00765 [Virgibacillus profundi]|nr:hypothetical protein CIT14_00765 [Virgibacillus profundi]
MSSDTCCSRRSLRILPTLVGIILIVLIKLPSFFEGESTITAEETHEDSCGRKGLGETPQCVARGGSPAARGKRNVFPERCISTHLLKSERKSH